VAVIGILPMGMQVQKDNRQETIINQDASVWLDAIRNGGKALDDLTNYVFAVTNYYGIYVLAPGAKPLPGVVGFRYAGSSATPEFPVTLPMTNGSIIVGLLSMPKYVDRQTPTPSIRSNNIVAFVRAMSGPASEKFPQTNADVQSGSFAYRLTVDIQIQQADTLDAARAVQAVSTPAPGQSLCSTHRRRLRSVSDSAARRPQASSPPTDPLWP